jgi:serine/threonine-protein kinase
VLTDDDTLDGTAVALERSLETTIHNWARYKIDSLIGAGGGGLVYRAEDPVLARTVALKFLRVDDATLARRLLREAQTQARIDHPNVCKVYEAGTVDGRPYVAMQFLDGATLDVAARALPLRERVALLVQIAEAVHAAHRIGLLHRDLKPTNVLVQKKDGEARAYVLDFGLAREMQADGTTQTGAVVGTPGYMSPEQARGERQLDRSSDVYSLGATLYAVLTGRAPFAGGAVVERLVRVVTEEPPTPRALDPTIPLDLETVVLKCLDKDPSRRYPTARALADDLERFLDGKPIAARPPSRAYRLRKWAGRNRAFVAAGVTAALGAIALGAYGVEARVQANRRARAAQRFGATLSLVEMALEREALLPRHDVRPALRDVRRRLDELEQQMRAQGGVEGPGELALGRGYLALREIAPARLHLQRAWDAGERTPEAALALGEAMGEQYHEARKAAENIGNEAVRTARLHEIAREIRDPALALLRSGVAGAPETAYVEALMAFYEERFTDARDRAAAAAKASPWFHAAHELAARALEELAYHETIRGKHAEAQTHLEEAGALVDQAATIARSDARLQELACERWVEQIRIERKRGGAMDKPMAEVRAACARSEEIDPDRPDPYRLEAFAWDWFAEWEDGAGRDPRPSLQRELEEANKALARDPRNTEALRAVASSFELRGEYEWAHGIDPDPSWKRALAAFDQAIALDPRAATSYNLRGTTYGRMGQRDAEEGRDPGRRLDAAVADFKRARQLVPTYAGAWDSEGLTAILRGQWMLAHGEDLRATDGEGLRALGEAARLNPANAVTCLNIGAAHIDLADYARATGGDPTPELDEAQRWSDQARTLDPTLSLAVSNLAEVAYRRAELALDGGRDPSEHLATARAQCERAAGIDKDSQQAFIDRALVELIAARAAVQAHRAPEAALAAAERALDGAERLRKNAQTHLGRAQVSRWRVEWKRSDAEIARGLAEARASTEPEAQAVAAVLLSKAGRSDEAKAAWARALASNQLLERKYASAMR